MVFITAHKHLLSFPLQFSPPSHWQGVCEWMWCWAACCIKPQQTCAESTENACRLCVIRAILLKLPSHENVNNLCTCCCGVVKVFVCFVCLQPVRALVWVSSFPLYTWAPPLVTFQKIIISDMVTFEKCDWYGQPDVLLTASVNKATTKSIITAISLECSLI